MIWLIPSLKFNSTLSLMNLYQIFYVFLAKLFTVSLIQNQKDTYLIGITICSFHVGLEPSTVDVRNVLSRNVAVTNGRTFALRCTEKKLNFQHY